MLKLYEICKINLRKKLIILLDKIWGRLTDELTYTELEKRYYKKCFQVKRLKEELEYLQNTRINAD